MSLYDDLSQEIQKLEELKGAAYIPGDHRIIGYLDEAIHLLTKARRLAARREKEEEMEKLERWVNGEPIDGSAWFPIRNKEG